MSDSGCDGFDPPEINNQKNILINKNTIQLRVAYLEDIFK